MSPSNAVDRGPRQSRREYAWTPHNLGFLAVDAHGRARRHSRDAAGSEVACWARNDCGQEVVLAKPQTMMNLSGLAVRMLLERYECRPGRD